MNRPEGRIPAFTEENRRRVDPDACACRVSVSGDEFILCPLHAAAPKLLAALEMMFDGCTLKPAAMDKKYDLQPARGGWDDPHDFWWRQVKDLARDAIAEAKEAS